MVESEVLCIDHVVESFRRAVKFFNNIVFEDQSGDLSPFPQAIYPIPFWIHFLTPHHTSSVGIIDKAVLLVG